MIFDSIKGNEQIITIMGVLGLKIQIVVKLVRGNENEFTKFERMGGFIA